MQNILEINNLKKIYKNGRGIENVNLSVREGDVVGLLGPNGSGKTTTMKAICGLIAPDAGEIKIFGHDTETEFEEAMADVGFLIEEPAICLSATAEQNLKMAARYYEGITPERIDKVLQLVKLDRYKKDKAARFSLGMKQRLGLALAMLSKPRLMVLDEPLNGLDIEGIIHIRELICALAEQKHTAFLISGHIAAELEKICNRVAILHEGCLLAFEDMETALRFQPTLEDYYLSVVREAEGGVEL